MQLIGFPPLCSSIKCECIGDFREKESRNREKSLTSSISLLIYGKVHAWQVVRCPTNESAVCEPPDFQSANKLWGEIGHKHGNAKKDDGKAKTTIMKDHLSRLVDVFCF